MSIKLKIKSKSLTEESHIIRHEEKKLLKQFKFNANTFKTTGHLANYNYWDDKNYDEYRSIFFHRTYGIRNEARATFLARAFISGKSYESIESKINDRRRFEVIIFPRICKLVAKYGVKTPGDVVWDNKKSVYVPTEQLINKLKLWCNLG